MKKILNITHHGGNENKNDSKISPVRMTIIKKTKTMSIAKVVGKKGILAQGWWECKLVWPL